MYITTFNFIFKSTNKPVNNVLIDVDTMMENYYLSAPLRHIGVNCSPAETECVTVDPLLLLDNIF